MSDRANAWFDNLDQSGQSKICVIDVDYVLYSQAALHGKDQNVVNASLAVNRLHIKDDEEGFSDDQSTITNMEVWRHTIQTTDENMYNKIMRSDEEFVAAPAGSLGCVMATTLVLAIFASFFNLL